MIRIINKNDLPLLIKINLEDEGVTIDNSQLSKRELSEHQKKIESYITDDDKGGFVFEEDDTAIGIIMFNIENCDKTYDWKTPYQSIDRHHFSEDGQMVTVFQLWVEPSHRRKQIASKLKKHLEKHAKSLSIETLYTHTEITNQHVIDLNMKLGYTPVRIGAIWDEILRISMIKDLRKPTVDSMLESVKDGKTCLVSADDLNEHMGDESLQLLDIRLEEDYDDHHLINSFHTYWADVLYLFETDLLDKNKTTIVICYTGQSSMHIATLLNLKGYKAYSLLDGLKNWPYDDKIKKA